MCIQPQVIPGCCPQPLMDIRWAAKNLADPMLRSCPGADKVMLSSLSWLPDCTQVIFVSILWHVFLIFVLFLGDLAIETGPQA